MYKSFINYLKCPICEATSLLVHSTKESEDQINEGVIYCSKCKTKFPIIDRIPLLVDAIMQEEILKNWDVSKEYEEYTLEPSAQVQKLVNDKSKDTTIALDAGCGSGAYTPFFNSKEIICLDLVPFFLKKLMKEYNGNSKLHVMIADITSLPFKEKCVEVVFCSNVLEHLNNEQILNVVNNFSNICKSVILVDVPNESNKLVFIFRAIFEKMGFYRGRIENPSDEKLHHHSKFGVSDLINMGFDVHGCIGWVSKKNIRIGTFWKLYDYIVWRYPQLGGTLIGIKQVNDNEISR
jgi:uncharacterized protein YbaR (Trm112 family)